MGLKRYHIGLAACTLLALAIGLYVFIAYPTTGDAPVSNRAPDSPPPLVKRESYSGHLIPIRVALVKANTTGRIVKVHVRKGDRVRAGDLLAELDDRMSRAELELARSKLKSAESQYRTTSAAAIVDVDPAEVKIKLRLAEAEVLAAEGKRSSAENRLADTKIHAPFDGTIMEVFIEKDGKVDPSDTRTAKLFELADLSGFLAQVDAPETVWRRVRKGQVARVDIPSLTGAHFEGEVFDIDPQVNPDTGCFAVRVKIQPSESDDLLISGIFAVVSLQEEGPVPRR